MKRSRNFKTLVVAAALPLLYLAHFAPGAPLGLTLIGEAQAVVGAPMTPLSVAGVARRSTVRAASATAASTSAASQQQAATAQQQQATAEQQAATAQQQAAVAQQQQAAAAQQQQAAAARPPGAPPVGTVVGTLPGGCVPETVSGVEYQNCGGVYYRAAFQGNNLVYVVQ